MDFAKLDNDLINECPMEHLEKYESASYLLSDKFSTDVMKKTSI